jgi:two-component system cell cycle response regulator
MVVGTRHAHQPGGPLAASESTRARRFALPDIAADDRTDEAIEAFLQGPDVRRHRPTAKRRRRRPAHPAAAQQGQPESAVAVPITETRNAIMPRVSTDIRTIPGRLEWNAALERESLRAARYGRPAAVAIVELISERSNAPVDPWLRMIAGPVATTLRGACRATDLVARVATSRFQVLLPETPEAGASRFAERISTACRGSIEHSGAPVTVRVSVASATRDHSLHEALADALRSIEAA